MYQWHSRAPWGRRQSSFLLGIVIIIIFIISTVIIIINILYFFFLRGASLARAVPAFYPDGARFDNETARPAAAPLQEPVAE